MFIASLLPTDDRLTVYEAQAAKLEDQRPHPPEAALEQLGHVCMNEILDLLMGTALEDHAKTIAEAVIGGLHSASQRIEREADRARDALAIAQRSFDGNEISDVELQELTQKAFAGDVASMAIEILRNSASETYTVGTGEIWTPWKGSVRQTMVTAATLDARDALRSIENRRTLSTDPGSQVVMFRGAPAANTDIDANRIFDALNWAKSQFPDMTLATTGAPGAEQLALKWARQKQVRIVLAKPDFKHNTRSAPFKANDELLKLEPLLCLTLEASLDPSREQNSPFGPAANLGQKAEARAVRHLKIGLKG